MEGFLNLHWSRWKRVLLTRSIAISPTLCLAIFSGIDRLTGMNDLLNVLQSVLLPFAVLPVLHFASNETIMRRFRAGVRMRVALWMLAILVMGINFYFTVTYLESLPNLAWVYLLVSIFFFIYLSLLAYLILSVISVNVPRLRTFLRHEDFFLLLEFEEPLELVES